MSVAKICKRLAGSPERDYFAVGAKTALKVWFSNDEPWATKFARRLQWGRLDPVWRRNSDRTVFSAPPLAQGFGATHPFCPAQQPLQHQRVLASIPLSVDLGSRTDRDHRAAAPQRGLSLFGRLAGLSGSHQFASLPGAVRTCGAERIPQVARPLACGDARPPGTSHLRPGQHRADRLWPSGACRSGLPPQEARPAFLSPPALLRGKQAMLLGRHLSSRRHPRLDRYDPFAGARLRQVAAWHSRSEDAG